MPNRFRARVVRFYQHELTCKLLRQITRCVHSMPPQRFALPSEVPGLAARRIAADILDGVLHKHRTLDEQLDGAASHPGLQALSDRDRALMRRLGAPILRRLGTLGAVVLPARGPGP